MDKTRVAAVTIGLVVALVGALVLVPLASAKQFEGDLVSPTTGLSVGSYEIEVSGRHVEVEGRVSFSAPGGYVLEGWLVDVVDGAPAYKLSLGELRGRTLEFEQRMVNVYTYSMLVITMEPRRDLDPNPAEPVAVAVLPAPFGQ